MREVVLRRPRAGGMTTSSLAVRGTELARVDTDSSRSGWSSLRLRRSRLFLCSLKLRPLKRLIKLWETISSKRCLCFLGMKILTNMADGVTEEKLFRRVNILSSLLREALDGDTQANGGGGTAMRKPAIITPDYGDVCDLLWKKIKELMWCNEAFVFCPVKSG